MIQNSELILNPDGSIYHLNLQPENIAPTLIFVGDPDRVEKITQHFDSIDFSTQKREFKTQTGSYKGKQITVISTGIGPDNIDIVMNELDALVNIDLKTRQVKEQLTTLRIVRLGTSGALQANIPVDSIVLSSYAMGLDNMLRSYRLEGITERELEDTFILHTDWDSNKGRPYAVKCADSLLKTFSTSNVFKGITATANGFYGPQGRVLRLDLHDPELNNKMDSFSFGNLSITNLEMETSAIYGLANLLGHHAVSLSAIIANRATKHFSEDPSGAVDQLILYALNRLAEQHD